MPRHLLAAAVCVAVMCATSCTDSRAKAKDDFVTQLITEGGLDRAKAECVADKFFATRSVAELKAFFSRASLTPAERNDFATIAAACFPTTTTTT